MKFAVIDVQGFQLPDFTPKELTILYNCKNYHHFLIKPPRPKNEISAHLQPSIRYLEAKHHHLKYDDGYVAFTEIHNIFQHLLIDKDVDVIYVKGSVKKKYLENVLSKTGIPIIDLDVTPLTSTTAPSLKKQKTDRCVFHHTDKPCSCSLNNSQIIFKYLLDVLGLE